MAKIAFVGNFYKTEVYEKIANGLKDFDIESFWIIPNHTQYISLKEKYGEDHVLLIDRGIIKPNADAYGDYKLNEILFADRVWKYDLQTGYNYLVSIQVPIKEFIQSNNIETIFGENTTSEELLISRMCKQSSELHCDYFSIMTTRIPNGRFFFFSDEKHTEVWKGKPLTDKTDDMDLEIRKPTYYLVNDAILKKKMSMGGVLKRLRYFLTNEHIEQSDPNVITNKYTRFKVASAEVINQQMYRFVSTTPYDEIKGKQYVFFGFHKQPESSVDVCGRYNEIQKNVIENIWRQLPNDWYLVIKEHTNAIGDRSLKYYKTLKKYPRIILADEKVDSKVLIQGAKLVITNTGTMGLEAALIGVPAVTLSKVVFNCLNYCKYMLWQDFEKYDSLSQLVDEINKQEIDVEPYRLLVAKYSFEGIMSDTHSMPEILEDEVNMNKLTKAFEVLVNRRIGDQFVEKQ